MKVLGYVNRFSRGVYRVQKELEENGNGKAFFDFSLITAFRVVENRSKKYFVEATNPNKVLFRGLLSVDNFNPYAKNPNIRKFFSEFSWVDEIGSGVRNVNKYLSIYTPNTKPLFIEDDLFKTIIPLIASVLGEEKAATLMELVALDKSKLNPEAVDAIVALDITPEYGGDDNISNFFFAKEYSLGWSWHQKGVELENLRIKINSGLLDNPSFEGWSWSEKGVELFNRRTMTLFQILLACLMPRNIEDIKELIGFNSRNKLREIYLNPLREDARKYNI